MSARTDRGPYSRTHSVTPTNQRLTDRQYQELARIKRDTATEVQRAAVEAHRPEVTYDDARRMAEAHTARCAALRGILKAKLLRLRTALEKEAEAGWEAWSASERASAFREYQRICYAIEARTKRKLNEHGLPIMNDPQRPGILATELGLYSVWNAEGRKRRAMYDLPNLLKMSRP